MQKVLSSGFLSTVKKPKSLSFKNSMDGPFTITRANVQFFAGDMLPMEKAD
jgi:hypothetical protein